MESGLPGTWLLLQTAGSSQSPAETLVIVTACVIEEIKTESIVKYFKNIIKDNELLF